MNELKFPFRQLRKNPGFTAVAVLTLALGIGANTAVFTLINTLLLRTLPGVNEPQRLVRVTDRGDHSLSYALYERLRDASQSLSGFAGGPTGDEADVDRRPDSRTPQNAQCPPSLRLELMTHNSELKTFP